MASSSEQKPLDASPGGDAVSNETMSLPSRSKSSGNMKIANVFRRQSTTGEIGKESVRRTSVAGPERKSSLTALPARFLRRRTKSSVERSENEEEAAERLGQLFFALPSEILTNVMSNLTLHDIYSLRLTSHATLSILCSNAGTVSRQVLAQTLSESMYNYLQSHLYMTPSPCHSLAPLLRTVHRQRVNDRTIYNTLSFIRMKVYQLPPNAFGFKGPSAIGNEVIVLLEQPAWTLYHFLESYRTILLYTHDKAHETKVGKFWSCKLCSAAITSLINSYPKDVVVPTYHLYSLLITHIRAATRSPSYAGAIERKIRGWNKALSNEDMGCLIVLGGLEMLSRISLMQGSYNKRIELIGEFLDKVTRNAQLNTDTKDASPRPGKSQRQTETANGLGLDAVDGDRDLTESLWPDFERLTQDHLDRLPQSDDFFTTAWRERIERDGLCDDEEELRDPIKWVQRMLYGPMAEEGEGQNPGQLVLYTGQSGVLPVYGAPPV